MNRLLPLFLLVSATLVAGPGKEELADRVVITKHLHRLELMHSGKVLRTYSVALGPHAVGPKQSQGDGRTPEGVYTIDARNSNSAFYKSLHISYPNAADRALAKSMKQDPGGDIMIHRIGKKFGWLGSAHRLNDWTLGCIAVTNQEIDEIWKLVPNGTPVEIVP